MAKTLLTGATGLIGRALLPSIENAVVLSRDAGQAKQKLGRVETYAWDAESGPPPVAALLGAEVVFNLAGEPVADGRWTAGKRRRIRDSRVVGTRNLVAGLGALPDRPRVLVSASAVGFYGDQGDLELDEQTAGGQGFLAEVCADWEREAMAAEQWGIRVVCVRIGFVLAKDGGALARMLTPFRMGAGGRLGSGKQWMPWISLEDVIGILLHASKTETIHGPMNAVGPRPVTNADFTKALGHALHRPTLLSVPKAALLLAFGEMSEMLVASQRVLPRIALESGYTFTHPTLADALQAALLSPR